VGYEDRVSPELFFQLPMPTADQLKKSLLAALANSPYKEKIAKLWLFGSQADGTATEQSDVDLLIDLKETLGLDFIDLENNLADALKRNVDLVSTQAVKPRLAPYIDRQKVLIYEG
jgi:hypothetical protein